MTDFSVRKLPVLSIPYAIPAMVYHISIIAIRVGKNGKLLEGRYLGLSFCSYVRYVRIVYIGSNI